MLSGGRTHLIGSGNDALKKTLLLLQETHGEAAKKHLPSPLSNQLTAAVLTEAAECLFGRSGGGGLCLHTKKALSFISKNFQRDITLDALSDFVGISARRLQGLFREELGCTISDYIRSFRISCACDMLRSANTSIDETAAAVGYNSRQHLTAAFRKCCGVTPQQFRKEWRDRGYRFTRTDSSDLGIFSSFIHTKNDLDII